MVPDSVWTITCKLGALRGRSRDREQRDGEGCKVREADRRLA